MDKETLEFALGNLKLKASGLKAVGLLAIAAFAIWLIGDHLQAAATALLLRSHRGS